MNREKFIEIVMHTQNGVQNDSQDVFVEVNEKTCSVPISHVLDHPERIPFEASYTLEDCLDHPAWDELYEQYCGMEMIR